MSNIKELNTRITGDQARDVALAVEALGLDASRTTIERPYLEPDSKPAEASAGLNRPLTRVWLGMLAGAPVGAAAGAAIGVVSTVALANLVFIGGLVGLILGALLALYGKLPSSPEAVELPADEPVDVRVDVANLDPATVSQVRGALSK